MVSAIVISHNYGRFLKKCVKSILHNNKNYISEIIIIDDSSSDNTQEVALNLKKKNKKIKFFKKDFQSLSKSTNYGIRKAKSKFITKIDADDYVSKNFFENFFKKILRNKLDFAFGDIVEISKKNKKSLVRQNYNFNNMLNYPMGSGTIFTKKLWKKVGGFNEKIFYQDDFDFWLKIRKNKKFNKGYISTADYFYNKHEKNMSRSLIKKNLTKLYIILRSLI